MNARIAAPIVMMGAVVLLAACGGGGGGGAEAPSATPYVFDLPSGFPQPKLDPKNPITTDKVALGRSLFYDRRMAINEQGSCASCHEQRLAFTDGRVTAIGPTGDVHPRNAMSLTNAVYNARQNWANPNVRNLRDQALAVLLNQAPIELGWAGHEQEILARLRADPAYVDSFRAAFPSDADPFTLNNVAQALASFTATLISGRSAYDRYHDSSSPDRSAMTAAAQRGEALFTSERLECLHCHSGFNLANSVVHANSTLDAIEYKNNALYNIAGPGPGFPLSAGNYPTDNQGLYQFTLKATDMGRFRPPTLRNIALTAPYMHDGSIATLREVIVDHYARGGRLISSGARAGDGARSPNKDALMIGFAISDAEVDDLLAFFDALTDWSFVCDERFSDPFGNIAMHEHCTATR